MHILRVKRRRIKRYLRRSGIIQDIIKSKRKDRQADMVISLQVFFDIRYQKGEIIKLMGENGKKCRFFEKQVV